MFRLSKSELENWILHFGTLKRGQHSKYAADIRAVFEAIQELMEPPAQPPKRIRTRLKLMHLNASL